MKLVISFLIPQVFLPGFHLLFDLLMIMRFYLVLLGFVGFLHTWSNILSSVLFSMALIRVWTDFYKSYWVLPSFKVDHWCYVIGVSDRLQVSYQPAPDAKANGDADYTRIRSRSEATALDDYSVASVVSVSTLAMKRQMDDSASIDAASAVTAPALGAGPRRPPPVRSPSVSERINYFGTASITSAHWFLMTSLSPSGRAEFNCMFNMY